MGQAAPLTLRPLQPTVRFAEDTLLLPLGEDGENEEGPLEAPWALPAGRQRLIRKDTPHYKKHFKVSKLPQPEAVVALLQGTQRDGQGSVGPGGWHNGPHTPWASRAEDEDEDEEDAEDAEDAEEAAAEEDEEKEAAVAPAPSVKVGLGRPLACPSCQPPVASSPSPATPPGVRRRPSRISGTLPAALGLCLNTGWR